MTQAFNLSQLANNLNTAGQLDATDGLTGAVPVANGGTGQTTLTANAVLLGNGTSGVTAVAPSTSGNVLVSNGTTWVSSAPSGGGQLQFVVFASSGTWVCPTGVTRVLATVMGAGSGGVIDAVGAIAGGTRGSVGYGYYTVTPGTSYTITVGVGGPGVYTGNDSTSTGGSTSFASFLTVAGASSRAVNGNYIQTFGAVTGNTLGKQFNIALDNYFVGIQGTSATSGSSGKTWSANNSFATANGSFNTSSPGASGQADGSLNRSGGVGGVVALMYVG